MLAEQGKGAAGREDAVRDLLAMLCATWNSRGLSPAALRNWEGLPAALVGNDLDVVVPPGDRRALVQATMDAATGLGWFPVQHLRRPYLEALKLCKFPEVGAPWVFHLDLFLSASWLAFPYCTALDMIEGAVPLCGGLCRVQESVEVFHTISHHLLWSGKIHKTKYVTKTMGLSPQIRKAVVGRLEESFGVTLAGRIWNWMEGGGPYDASLRSAARRAVALRALRRPVRSSCLWARAMTMELGRITGPPGLIFEVAPGGRSQEIACLASWLAQVWKYNHVVSSIDPFAVVAGSGVTRDEVLRYGYGSPSRVGRTGLRALRTRGWIVGVESEARGTLGKPMGPSVDLSADGSWMDAARRIAGLLRARTAPR